MEKHIPFYKNLISPCPTKNVCSFWSWNNNTLLVPDVEWKEPKSKDTSGNASSQTNWSELGSSAGELVKRIQTWPAVSAAPGRVGCTGRRNRPEPPQTLPGFACGPSGESTTQCVSKYRIVYSYFCSVLGEKGVICVCRYTRTSESSAWHSDTYVSAADSVRSLSCHFRLAIKQTLADSQLHLCLKEEKISLLAVSVLLKM